LHPKFRRLRPQARAAGRAAKYEFCFTAPALDVPSRRGRCASDER
jgi:hypothetical protein